jgi:hypothetical protein
MSSSKKALGAYAVGYGKPPVHTRFRKGQSGNRRGRPVKMPVRRAKALALAEAYRGVAVVENGMAVPLTALQAIMRRQVALALEGHGPAQRAVIEAVMGIEEEEAMAAQKHDAGKAKPHGQDDHAGAIDRIAVLLRLAAIGFARGHDGPSASAPEEAHDAASPGELPRVRTGASPQPPEGRNRVGRIFKFLVKFPVKFRVS